jgi:hypothetical protein
MTRDASTMIALAMIIALGSAGAAQSIVLDSASTPTPTVTIDIHDYAQVPRSALSRAMAEAATIFSGTGIRLEWIVRRQSSTGWYLQPASMAAGTITVQIIPVLRDERLAEDPTTLGAVPGAHAGGRMAYLFSSRIEVVARRNATTFGALLGIVLAHEIGHVLLPGRPHSALGIMRPFCATQQIQDILVGRRGFSAAETRLMRSRAAADPSHQ